MYIFFACPQCVMHISTNIPLPRIPWLPICLVNFDCCAIANELICISVRYPWSIYLLTACTCWTTTLVSIHTLSTEHNIQHCSNHTAEYRVQLEAPLLQFNLTENVQTFTDIRDELDTLFQAGVTEAEELRDNVDAIIISLMSIDDSIPTIQTQVVCAAYVCVCACV